MKEQMIADKVYLIGGPGITEDRDAFVYAVELGELVIIDSGCGSSFSAIWDNMVKLGLDAYEVKYLVLTHAHIDHIGGANQFISKTQCEIVAHHLDANVLTNADPKKTAASWYGIKLEPIHTDIIMDGEQMDLSLSKGTLHLLHTPGHTPGSIMAYVDTADGRILFAQDVHGPFLKDFDSNVQLWRKSMQKIIDLQPDYLCEGHYGIFTPKAKAVEFINGQLDVN